MIDRKDVDIKETWDLSLIFKTEEDYEKELNTTISNIDNFVSNYESKLNNNEIIIKALNDYEIILESFDKLGSYAYFDYSVDVFNEQAAKRMSYLDNMMAKYYSKLSFFESEIKDNDEKLLFELSNDIKYGPYINKLIEEKKHSLSKESEKVLAQLSNTLSLPYSVYNEAKLKDTTFDDFIVDEKVVSMDYNKFETTLEGINDTNLRRKSFEVFSDSIKKFNNTIAAVYKGEVERDKSIAEIRGYNSVFDYLLSKQDVSVELYDRQIDVIMSELAPHMRKYAKILEKIHNLDKIHYCDLKIDVDPTYAPSVSFDEAKDYIIDGISIFGEEYQSVIRKAFEERWIDYAQNKGKSTGAFCGSPYGSNSFILSSFNNTMSEVLTLAHELGHAGQGYYTNKTQNILNANPSLYIIEAPSTTNELIVANYLLQNAKDDKRMRRWVLSQMIARTYYHNFVTHFMEAAYQREVYRLIDSNEHIDANKLNEIFESKLKEFWGDSIVIDDGAKYTWMRQPHYYSGLYSYTYSAGLTVGTMVSLKIRELGESFASKWIDVLRCGGYKKPVDLCKMVDVDITSDKPLKDTIAYIGSIIDEIEEISKELGEI